MRSRKKERMTEQIIKHLSEKYDVISPLGSGMNSTVYLVRHKSLDRQLAVKIIPADKESHCLVLSEARLLKSIHHPGIPMIYDIESDNHFFYLMEEYVTGDALDQYLLHHSFISIHFYLKCIEELCQIYEYLHALPTPFLYQDLKPEHIIVGPDRLRLIDFGGLCPLQVSEIKYPVFGNADFSAPEVLAGSPPTFSSDVYTIGKMMAYLATYLPRIPENIDHIIHKATNLAADKRYETVALLSAAIKKEQASGTHLAKSIAVIGAYAGSGATHAAISLTSSLNKMGVSSFYLEANESKALHMLSRFSSGMKERDGGLEYRWFFGYPKYGPGILVSYPISDLAVIDYGQEIVEADLMEATSIVLVCASCPWHLEDILQKAKDLAMYKDKLTILCAGDSYFCRYLKEQTKLKVLALPYTPDPFLVSRQSMALAAKLMGIKERFPFILNFGKKDKHFQKP